MKTRLIILANSFRPGGRCIAGIDIETGEWIRPVSRDADRAVPVSVAENVKLLDIVSIPLASDKPRDCYQRENRFVDSWDWKVVDSLSPNEIIKYCESNTVILHNRSDKVYSVKMEALPFEQWKSLQLVRKEVKFHRSPTHNNPDRWAASFYVYGARPLAFVVTDPMIQDRLNNGEEVGTDCILTLSLAAPWAPTENAMKRCYKLVAGVIEL